MTEATTNNVIIRGAYTVNEGSVLRNDVLISNGRIAEISESISSPGAGYLEIDAEGLLLMPGVIDDQVHFREPGLTHKAEIYTEARAAVAGGTTSFMEMPNTVPQAVTQEALQAKYDRAAQASIANYSFFMGATNDNIEELKKTSLTDVCGIKIFMGSSTGNMLVDNAEALEEIFSLPHLIAIHSEDESIIRENMAAARERFGDDIPVSQHPYIRSVDACYQSTLKALALAKKHNTRLHVLHITTQEEAELFDNTLPLPEKRITAEVCVHHLWFAASEYRSLGNLIKCNPAIKEARHRKALWYYLLDDKLDIIATDHAPHTFAEKQQKYTEAPSGLPLVQHSLLMMIEAVKAGRIPLERVVEKMCHAPAECFKIKDRGYLRPGYWADLVLVDYNGQTKVEKENLLYKCQWSMLEGHTFPARIVSTFVNGHRVYHEGQLNMSTRGMRLEFDR